VTEERRLLLCPRCRAPVPLEESLRPPSFPFCSPRCRAVDLGRWFAEGYVVPEPLRPDDTEAIEAVLAARRGEG